MAALFSEAHPRADVKILTKQLPELTQLDDQCTAIRHRDVGMKVGGLTSRDGSHRILFTWQFVVLQPSGEKWKRFI